MNKKILWVIPVLLLTLGGAAWLLAGTRSCTPFDSSNIPGHLSPFRPGLTVTDSILGTIVSDELLVNFNPTISNADIYAIFCNAKVSPVGREPTLNTWQVRLLARTPSLQLLRKAHDFLQATTGVESVDYNSLGHF